jgi:hypothetical protein
MDHDIIKHMHKKTIKKLRLIKKKLLKSPNFSMVFQKSISNTYPTIQKTLFAIK